MPRFVYAVLTLAAVAALCTSCRPGAGVTRSPSSPSSTRPYADGELSLLVEPDQGLAPIYALIASARDHVDLTMYELVDTDAELALEQAAGRGVTVRVVLDANRERAANTPAFAELAAMGVQVTWADTRYAATHQKTLVVDRSVAVVMSLNLTSRFYADTRDFAVLDRNASDVAAIESTFDADFAHATVSTIEGAGLIWSPHRSAPAMLDIIGRASSSLLVENEEMAYPPVTAALIQAARRGVRVVVVMTDQPQWHSAFTKLVAAGVGVRVFAKTAPLYIHAKAIVADDGTPNGRSFVGSENFSAASLGRNRELGLLTSDRPIVTGLASVVARDASAGEAWRP